MFRLGSPANKRCVILRAKMAATITKNKYSPAGWVSTRVSTLSFFFLFFFLKRLCYEKWQDYGSGWSRISLRAAFRLKVAALNFLNISMFILRVRDIVMQAALVFNSTYYGRVGWQMVSTIIYKHKGFAIAFIPYSRPAGHYYMFVCCYRCCFFGFYQLLFISCDNSKHKLAKDVTSWQPC